MSPPSRHQSSKLATANVCLLCGIPHKRHTHATILLADLRENIKVVSERLGHASVTVTLTVYSHVMPGNQRQAVSRFAEHMAEAA